MSAKNVNFGDKKTKKSDFWKNKKVTNIDDNDADKILVSKQGPYGKKNHLNTLLDKNDNDVIRPLCIKLLEMMGYVRKFESNTTMLFKIIDKQLLKKYNQIWKRVEKLSKIEFDSKPVYDDDDDDKYIKTKIKMYGAAVNTSFQDKKHHAIVYQ